MPEQQLEKLETQTDNSANQTEIQAEISANQTQRYFVWFSYDGSAYHGWQIQPTHNSVQQELQRALSTILRQEIEVVGAGRTDAGVHAREMAAHFDFPPQNLTTSNPQNPTTSKPHTPKTSQPLNLTQLTYRLNRILPRDISVQRIEPVPHALHARFSAVRRTYHYFIHTAKNPFLRQYSCELHYPLDFDLMSEAASHLLEVEDFGAFCKSHTDVKTTICHVYEARWIQTSPHAWYFRISANRFLRNMVRAVVGTLIEVGRGRMTIAEFRSVVAGKKRTAAGESMPAQALFLEKVEYPAF